MVRFIELVYDFRTYLESKDEPLLTHNTNISGFISDIFKGPFQTKYRLFQDCSYILLHHPSNFLSERLVFLPSRSRTGRLQVLNYSILTPLVSVLQYK